MSYFILLILVCLSLFYLFGFVSLLLEFFECLHLADSFNDFLSNLNLLLCIGIFIYFIPFICFFIAFLICHFICKIIDFCCNFYPFGNGYDVYDDDLYKE